MSGSSSGSGFRDESLGLWDRMAAGWGRDGDSIWEASRAVGEWMVAAVHPGAGDTVLELAAGPGDTGFAAASLVGDSGRLICTDFAPEMVAVARSRGAALGLANVEYQVLDAERIELDSESVDCVLCRWGYMLMENPALALRETRRVLGSGGRLALSVWGEPADNAWASVPAAVLVNGGWLEPPSPRAPGSSPLQHPSGSVTFSPMPGSTTHSWIRSMWFGRSRRSTPTGNIFPASPVRSPSCSRVSAMPIERPHEIRSVTL
jgi:SAM-dependent methyltransferase